MTTRKTPSIRYFGTGPLPVYLGFTTDEAAFSREMKRLNVDNPPEFVSCGADGTTHLLRRKGKTPTIIVCVRMRKDVTLHQIIGLLVHEAVHCFQHVKEIMREDEPSSEFEAYTVQSFAQWFMEEIPSRKRKG